MNEQVNKVSENRKSGSGVLAALTAILAVVVAVQSYYLYKIYQRGSNEGLESAPGISVRQAQPVQSSAPKGSASRIPDIVWLDPDEWFGLGSDRWDPFAEIAQMRERMNRLFDDSFRRFQIDPDFAGSAWESLTFSPEMDLADDGSNYVMRFDLPGVDKANISVSVDGRILTVSGRTEEKIEKKDGRHVYRTERRSGQFERSLTLPGPVDDAGIRAEHKNGVLTVTVPKKAETEARRTITVQ